MWILLSLIVSFVALDGPSGCWALLHYSPKFNPFTFMNAIPAHQPNLYTDSLLQTGAYKPQEPFLPSDHTYDFIIVGSGPAGCVLANRLSANPKWKILLLEAGAPETIVHKIPLFAAYMQATASNWGYIAERQNGVCMGMDGQRCSYPRGKALGGTSTINYMIYNRGNRRDFDRWAADGNVGWSYDEVLPYFKRSEASHLKSVTKSSYHGEQGELSVEHVPYRSRIVKAYVKSAKQAGHPEVDYNGHSQLGVSYLQATTLNGVRHSAATAFLNPIRHRKNLHIMTRSRVTKLLINPYTQTAYGVEYHCRKQHYTARVRKEVILSAGTFGSAQLLMLSGIGPRDHLAELGIPLVANLPVSETMYDHASHFGPTFIVNTTDEAPNTRTLGINDAKQLLHGTGKLTIPGGVESLTFLKTSNSLDPPDYPDAEIVFCAGNLGSDEGTGIRRGMRLQEGLYNKVFRPLEDPKIDSWTAVVMQFRPKAKGYMRLKDDNPYNWPKFYTNWFQNEYDVQLLLDGIKEAIRISQMPAMQKVGARIHDIPLPQCAHLHFGSDAYWRCSIRTISSSLHHQVGTCKMGPDTDKSSVVDPQLRVHGIQALRVADCSVVPRPLTGHTNAVSFMIGEKLADMLHVKWENQHQ